MFYLFQCDRPKFRSYKPQDESLKDKVLEDAKPGNVEEEVKDQLSAANTKVVIEELVSNYLQFKILILISFYYCFYFYFLGYQQSCP